VIPIFPDRSYGRRNPKIDNETEPSLPFPTAQQVGGRTADIMSDLLFARDEWRTGWKPTRKKRPRWVLAGEILILTVGTMSHESGRLPDSTYRVKHCRVSPGHHSSVRQSGSMMPKRPTVNTTEVVCRCDMRTVS